MHTEAAHDEVFTDVALHLQDLVLESTDVEQLLGDLVLYSATRLSSPGMEIHCGVAVARKKKPTAISGSDPSVRVLDQLQNKYGDGPGLTAMRASAPVLVQDAGREKRWPEYAAALVRQGFSSAVSLPLALDDDASGALSLYCRQRHGFSNEDLAAAQAFAAQVSKSLRMALRIDKLQGIRDGMGAAMKSRTVIDLATGAIMAQNRCSQREAFNVLLLASNTRNKKLKDVAAAVIASVSGSSDTFTYFDE